MLLRLFIAALWSPTGKGADLLALVGDVYCIFVTFPCGILGQVWYLIVSFPDICLLSYLELFSGMSGRSIGLSQYQAVRILKVPCPRTQGSASGGA